MNVINRLLLKHGLAKTLLAITAFSIALSILLTYLSIGIIFGLPQADMPDYLLIGAIVPAIVAPIISFGMLKQILKINALEKETRYLANTDALTGLYNHRAFYENASDCNTIAKQAGNNIHVLLADIDGFKIINDTFGHLAGDLALKQIAGMMSQTLREADVVGRVGGDEFVICLPDTTRETALSIANRILESVKNSNLVYDGQVINLSLSIGLSSSDDATHELDSIIKMADQALYRAKSTGKSKIAE